MERILVTGGAGFFGSTIALRLKATYPAANIIALDNLRRRGSEFNLPRLRACGIEFIHGDIRSAADVDLPSVDVIVECSAEPSALAGRNGDARYLLDGNLGGAINCLELARRCRSALLFISSSRVYPHDRINALPFKVEAQRFVLDSAAALPPGVTSAGLSTEFGLPGRRTLYGASKLAAELVVQEFADVYNIPSLILRLGVIAGPWQMGKLDQGFVALWVARHLMGRSLNYCGFGGQGRQLRDVLHVDDAADLVGTALSGVGSFRGEVFNAGGGPERTVSLAELTAFCQGETARTVVLGADPANRPGDIPWYVTDNTAVAAALQWRPTYSVRSIVADTSRWLTAHPQILSEIFDA